MPFIEHCNIDNGLLLLWEMTETPEELQEFEQEFADNADYLKISHPKRQREWLTVQQLLRNANCSPQLITRDSNGKPGINHQLYQSVSISHSAKLAGIFLHPGTMVGLDIEDAERDFARVEKKYLSREESALAKRIPNGAGLFWCIKEAAYKAAGIPGLVFTEQIEISETEPGTLTTTVYGNSTLEFKIYQRMIAGQLIVCLTLQQ
ncbi:4'-phosphopantetheinyl transferase family protein [Mangrovibacterium lignilyticum]|uniref:4'-phosphopantetheinyl transferase family protein n=1 Tax=Mangrovibacterium lignilyticum TaxID=2668052 RepID=UPI0013D4D90C|nr:4'-phosphopantetheinyl transferase superfamily protein [Mangrovibacterium lignilyticum]